MSQTTLRSGVDAWVSSAKPNANNGRGVWLRLSNGTDKRQGVIYFKNPAPKGATILSAILHLSQPIATTASFTVNVQRNTGKWSETKVNYNNRPAVSTAATATVTQAAGPAGRDWAFDVTTLMQTMTDTGINYGFTATTTSGNEIPFGSFQGSANKPTLVIQWTLAPDAPIDLTPSGGATVTLAKPTLLFNFHDVAGVHAMQSCQVQINGTNVFTAPSYDSGEVLTSNPELDLSTTAVAYTAPAVGVTQYWRVRVKDDAGKWSAWSDSRAWVRGSRGTTTINSPTVTLADPTQDIIWTVSGATQTAWRIVISDDSNPTVPLLDTGKKSGNNNTYTIPKGIIKSEKTIYRITLRTWDDPGRVAGPSDMIYNEVAVALAFDANGTSANITNTTVSPRYSRQPGVLIQWDRGNAPDSYEIRRGDSVGSLDVIDTDINPVDLLVSGTTYRYIDRDAAPFRNYTWRVIAKVGTALQYGQAVTGSFTVDTVWLNDVETDRLVPILFRNKEHDTTFEQPQIASVLQPVGSKYVVRTVQGQAGLQGSVTGGVIVDSYGDTAQNWVSNLAWMRDRPWNKVRLTLGNRNLNVVIGNIVIAPYINGGPERGAHDRQVSFDFWEQSA